MHPVGPHNSGVYWLRRVVAIAVVVIVIVAAVWWVVSRSSGPDVDPAASTGASGSTTELTGVLAPDPPTTRSSSGTTATGTRTSTGETPSGADASGKATKTSAKKSSEKSTAKKTSAKKSSKQSTAKKTSEKSTAKKTSAKKTSKQSTPVTTSKKSSAKKSTASKTSAKKTSTAPASIASTTTAPPKPSYDAQGRLICSDADTAVKSILWSTTVAAGSQPRLGMTVTNTGPKTCRRDVSGSLQVYTVYTAGGDRVWSTNDCFPGTGHEVRTLAPGATASYIIKWAGTTSTPGCDTPRVAVKPGKYELVAQLGDIKGAPAAFTVTG